MIHPCISHCIPTGEMRVLGIPTEAYTHNLGRSSLLPIHAPAAPAAGTRAATHRTLCRIDTSPHSSDHSCLQSVSILMSQCFAKRPELWDMTAGAKEPESGDMQAGTPKYSKNERQTLKSVTAYRVPSQDGRRDCECAAWNCRSPGTVSRQQLCLHFSECCLIQPVRLAHCMPSSEAAYGSWTVVQTVHAGLQAWMHD